jgi:hypothetical protein
MTDDFPPPAVEGFEDVPALTALLWRVFLAGWACGLDGTDGPGWQAEAAQFFGPELLAVMRGAASDRLLDSLVAEGAA